MEFDVADPITFNISISPRATVILSAVPNPAPVVLMPVPGASGATGQPGTNTPVPGEVAGGDADGENLLFTTSHPFTAGSTSVTVNGLQQFPDDYAESGDSAILFTVAPQSGDTVVIAYLMKAAA
jgi:hypothetical protein